MARSRCASTLVTEDTPVAPRACAPARFSERVSITLGSASLAWTLETSPWSRYLTHRTPHPLIASRTETPPLMRSASLKLEDDAATASSLWTEAKSIARSLACALSTL